MSPMLLISLACTALACGPAAPDGGSAVSEAPRAKADAAQPSLAPDAAGEATPPTLIEFDGGWEFLKTSRQLRVWRAAVEFTLEVDETGQPSDCEVIDAFRQTYVNTKLCEVLMEHHSFTPARNARNEAVVGSYRSSLSYADLREEFD